MTGVVPARGGGPAAAAGRAGRDAVRRSTGGAAFCFQAEDGIRVLYVTGVQTCALRISIARARRAGSRASPVTPARASIRGSRRCSRSEERRVGKEGRVWLWVDRI